jgi:molybdopterin-guanine dinucleotide biosynthesis protein A
MKVEVCILAGGKSSRMGQPKSAMLLDGAPLLHWSRRIAAASPKPPVCRIEWSTAT